jgi:hypothetical protein
MKKILILFAVFTFLSCKETTPQQQFGDSIVLSKEEYESLKRSTSPEYPKLLGKFTTDPQFLNDDRYYAQVGVVEIDSCEYVGKLHFSDMDFLSHKGNCKFCTQRREIEQQKLVDEIIYRLTNKRKDTVQ